MTPLVTVIVTHHLNENDEYLKLCLDSILASEGIPFELICISDAKNHPNYVTGLNNPEFNRRLTIFHKPDLNTASAKVNWATLICHPNSKYFWFISDDVMVSKYAMKTMVEGLGDNPIICNPMSNSDNGSQFWGDLGVPLKLSHADIKSGPQPYLEFAAQTNCAPKPFLIPVRQFIAFYCTMIPRKVWEMVGELDEKCDVRHNDQDFCIRAMKLGIMPMINLGAFAIHFGDKTLPKVTTADQYQAATDHFMRKHGL